ncbi:hypothetical protein M1C59_02730 [Gordonia terrae]|uniref:hypothetical protein n=1 Tax=Gordonia terrae TaxID=2055 RepID=UPI00200A5435|nr:hypothetical protein [Gordonia terrae]UPW09790.1 hypothetical protein M1C59_02730 [Gordonia terrae]
MTTIIDVAHLAGVRTKQARRVAQQVGVVTQDRKGYVPLPEDDARRLVAVLRDDHPIDDDSEPGLPLSALADPSFREAFSLMRFEREARLMDLLVGSQSRSANGSSAHGSA